MEYDPLHTWCTSLHPCWGARQGPRQIVSWRKHQGPGPKNRGPSAQAIRGEARGPRPVSSGFKLPNSLIVNKLWINCG